jgi:hypothetical protein
MRHKNETFTPASLANVLAHNNKVEICCDHCGHGKQVDLAVLIERFGLDYAVPEIGKHFTCASCMMLDGAKRTGSARIISR